MCCLFVPPSMEDGADGLCGMHVEFKQYFFYSGEFHSKVGRRTCLYTWLLQLQAL